MKKKRKALIIGAGIGGITTAIYLAKNGFEVYGIDIAPVGIKLAKEWLKKESACRDGFDWFCGQDETLEIKIIEGFIKEKNHLDWANWLIVRCMKYEQYISYAVYSANQVIKIYEAKYPDDKRPRDAINAAKK